LALDLKLNRRAFFAMGKNAKPFRARFLDRQSADRLLSQKNVFIFSAWGLEKTPCA